MPAAFHVAGATSMGFRLNLSDPHHGVLTADDASVDTGVGASVRSAHRLIRGIMSVQGTIVFLRRLLLAGALVGSLAAPSAAAARPRLELVAPSAAVQPSHTLRVAGQLANVRRQTVFRVRVRSARVTRTGLRTDLPLYFRRIRHGRAVIVHLRFDSREALQRQRFRLVMSGTYRPRR